MKAIIATSSKIDKGLFQEYTIDDILANPNGHFFNNLQKCGKIMFRKDKATRRRDPSEIERQIVAALDKAQKEEQELVIDTKMTIEELMDMVRDGKYAINYGEDIAVAEQRGLVASNKTKSKMILGLINKDEVIPSISLMAEIDSVGDIRLIIVDGEQRSGTIYQFLRNELVITGTGTALDGHTFKDLPEDVRKAFLTRKIRFNVTHWCLRPTFPGRFRVLNTSSTKMSKGETLLTNFSGNKAYQEMTTKVKNDYLCSGCFGVTELFSSDGKTEFDERKDIVANVAYVLAADFLIDRNMYSTNSAVGAASNAFLLEGVYNAVSGRTYGDELCEYVEKLPFICTEIKRYFGTDFCRNISRYQRKNPVADDRFPEGYFPASRNKGLNMSYLQTVYFIMDKLCDKHGHCIYVDKMPAVAKLLDETFRNKDWNDDFVVHKSASAAAARVNYFINALKKVGVYIG